MTAHPDRKPGRHADLIEEAEAHAGLLRAYGDVQEQPTHAELWAGCKDAAPVLRRCAERLLEFPDPAAHEAAQAERDEEHRKRMELWCELHGTGNQPGAHAAKTKAEEAELVALGDLDTLRAAHAALQAEVERFKAEHVGACETIAAMHAAAVGEVSGPIRGVVEDVADLRATLKAALDALEEGKRLHGRIMGLARSYLRDAADSGDAHVAAFTDAADELVKFSNEVCADAALLLAGRSQ